MLDAILVEGNLIYLIFLVVAIVAFHLKQVWLRYPVMLAALATIGFLQMGCPSPIGAVQQVCDNLAEWPTMLTFFAKIAIVLAAAFFYGKIFCGWVCPKGSIQEFLYQRKLRFSVPPRLDRALRKLKYVMLAAIIALPLGLHYQPFNSETSPFAALFNLGGGLAALILLGLTLLASLFVYRPFCRYVCPTGALLGLMARLSRLRVFVSNCTNCQLACRKCEIGALTCPTKSAGTQFSIDKAECIMCGECRHNCPQGLRLRLKMV